jgi:hypothetical protein
MDETTTYEEVPTEEETENTTTSSGLDGFDIMGIILIATICIVVIAKVFHKTFGRFKITSKWFNFEDLKESE